MKSPYPFLLLFVLFLLASCNNSFDHSSKGMQQLHQVLDDKFGAEAWYSSIILVHDAGGDDVVTVEHSADPDETKQEQWTWFHGFWEKKADITLQFSGMLPRDVLFQLQKGACLFQLGQLIENTLKELDTNPANGRGQLVMAAIKMNDPSPARPHTLSYMIQLKTGKGISYSYVYDGNGQKIQPVPQL